MTRPKPRIEISNCTITTNNAANEHTRAAVEALAKAAEANANAIREIAEALKNNSAPSYGMYFENGDY